MQVRWPAFATSFRQIPNRLGTPLDHVERGHLCLDRRPRLRLPRRQDAPRDLQADGHCRDRGPNKSDKVCYYTFSYKRLLSSYQFRYLKDNLPFVDPNNTAIWGWSYGGFASASALAMDTEHVFKCAMSVAPVTNWIYYGINILRVKNEL